MPTMLCYAIYLPGWNGMMRKGMGNKGHCFHACVHECEYEHGPEHVCDRTNEPTDKSKRVKKVGKKVKRKKGGYIIETPTHPTSQPTDCPTKPASSESTS